MDKKTSLLKTSICDKIGLFGSVASILGLAASPGRKATLKTKG